MSRNVARLSCATPLEDAKMNEKQIDLICIVMEMIGETIDHYDKDEYHAPAPWLLNNWWATLNSVLAISSSNHGEGPESP